MSNPENPQNVAYKSIKGIIDRYVFVNGYVDLQSDLPRRETLTEWVKIRKNHIIDNETLKIVSAIAHIDSERTLGGSAADFSGDSYA